MVSPEALLVQGDVFAPGILVKVPVKLEEACTTPVPGHVRTTFVPVGAMLNDPWLWACALISWAVKTWL